MFRIFISVDINSCDSHCEDILNGPYCVIGLDSEYTDNLCSLVQICVPGPLNNQKDYIEYEDLYVIPSSLQYCDCEVWSVYLLHLSKMGSLPKMLSKLLRSIDIIKVGCGIINDSYIMEKTFNQNISSIIDNQLIAKSLGYSVINMSDLAFSLFSVRKKRQSQDSLIDWKETLTEIKIKYAVYDAYLSLIIYFKLIKYEKSVIISFEKSSLLPIPSPSREEEIKEEPKEEPKGEAKYMLACLRKTTLFSGGDAKIKSVINTAKNSCVGIFINLSHDEILVKIDKYLEILQTEKIIQYFKETGIVRLIS